MANLQRIKDILKEKGLTIRYLANELGISEQGLQKLIRENSTKIETLESISKILKVSIITFFEDGINSESTMYHQQSPNDSILLKLLEEKEKKIEKLTEELRAMERKVGSLEAKLENVATLGNRTADNVSTAKPSSQSRAFAHSASAPLNE